MEASRLAAWNAVVQNPGVDGGVWEEFWRTAESGGVRPAMPISIPLQPV